MTEKSQIATLFRDIQRGNTGAFDKLFMLYHHRLLAFALQYTRQQEIAEEITSELFVRIWIRRDRLAGVTNPEIYLFASIRNACLNQLRSEKRRAGLFSMQPAGEMPEPPAENRATAMEDTELARLLDRAVAALPEQRRIIFKLVKEEGMKSKAVAEILDLSVRTVENQLYKAVKTLAEALSAYLGYSPQAKPSKKQALQALSLLFFW